MLQNNIFSITNNLFDTTFSQTCFLNVYKSINFLHLTNSVKNIFGQVKHCGLMTHTKKYQETTYNQNSEIYILRSYEWLLFMKRPPNALIWVNRYFYRHYTIQNLVTAIRNWICVSFRYIKHSFPHERIIIKSLIQLHLNLFTEKSIILTTWQFNTICLYKDKLIFEISYESNFQGRKKTNCGYNIIRQL